MCFLKTKGDDASLQSNPTPLIMPIRGTGSYAFHPPAPVSVITRQRHADASCMLLIALLPTWH